MTVTRVADRATGGPQAHAKYRYRIQSRNRQARSKGASREQRRPQEGSCCAPRRNHESQASSPGPRGHGQAARQESGRQPRPNATRCAERGSGVRFDRTSVSCKRHGRKPKAARLVRSGLRPARRRDGPVDLRLGGPEGEAEAAGTGGDRGAARHRQARSRGQVDEFEGQVGLDEPRLGARRRAMRWRVQLRSVQRPRPDLAVEAGRRFASAASDTEDS